MASSRVRLATAQQTECLPLGVDLILIGILNAQPLVGHEGED